jgi:5-formyltetrahydrofolate cyclo-ligase
LAIFCHVREEKKHLRALLRNQRRSLSVTEVTEKSRLIRGHLLGLPPFQRARTLVLYSADENEVQTEMIWRDAVAAGKAVYYPRITADRADLEFVCRYPGARLIPGTFGILIPPGNELLTGIGSSDVVLTPGVGFDRNGRRLGRGSGYYDRAFLGILADAVRVALAYTIQVIPSIPVNLRDEAVHYLVTESGVIDCATATSCT